MAIKKQDESLRDQVTELKRQLGVAEEHINHWRDEAKAWESKYFGDDKRWRKYLPTAAVAFVLGVIVRHFAG